MLEEFSVSCYNFVNYKILMGDASDNLPGVTGLGPKKPLKLFPALAEDTPIQLADIVIESEYKREEHDLYARIVERKHQLIINEKLVDLKAIPLSDANIEQIQSCFKSSYELNSHMFMQMYTVDRLGEAIPNTPTWLNQVFGPLNSFK